MCETLCCSSENCDIEYGYCHCGCGGKTNICIQNHIRYGWVKGEPKRYINGHHARLLTPDYIINEETGCWEWQKCKNKEGYGQKMLNGIQVGAHRYYYELYKGLITKNMCLDHLCRNPGCVNPEHLEVVTNDENIRRGSGAKLNWEKVRKIRELYFAEDFYQSKLADMYAVTQTTISHIILNKSWKETT